MSFYKRGKPLIYSATDCLIVYVLGAKNHMLALLAVAIPRPSLEEYQSTSAITSVFTPTGHKMINSYGRT
jgi:hypothetical protein